MAWTAEQKREKRKQQKALALLEKKKARKELVQIAPGNDALKKPYSKKDLGNNKVDYGGHQLALNFPDANEISSEIMLAMKGSASPMSTEIPLSADALKIGDLSIGLVYEGDWKQKSKLAGKGERKMCENSEKYYKFLLIVKEMLMPHLHSTLQLLVDDTLRVNILRGARTKAHTDSFRGNTPNAIYIVKEDHICHCAS